MQVTMQGIKTVKTHDGPWSLGAHLIFPYLHAHKYFTIILNMSYIPNLTIWIF